MNETKRAVHIVFDGPPSHESGRFVECETPEGKSIRVGEWHEREDGLWELRIPLAQQRAPSREVVDERLEGIKKAARYQPIGDGYYDPFKNNIEAVDDAVEYLRKALAQLDAQPEAEPATNQTKPEAALERWTAGVTHDNRAYIQDERFDHDARLYIDGDFPSDHARNAYRDRILTALRQPAEQAEIAALRAEVERLREVIGREAKKADEIAGATFGVTAETADNPTGQP